MARLSEGRRTDSRTVRRAVNRKETRDGASLDLAAIKRDMIVEAEAAGVTTLHKTDPNTGQRVVLCVQRKGAPVDESKIGDVIELLPEEKADALFPPVVRRTWNWPAIQDFVSREHPKGSKQAIARNRIVEAIEQNSNYTLRVYDAKRTYCVECAAVLTAPKGGINLCAEHRKWFKLRQLALAASKDDNPIVTVEQFNDERRKNVRAAWLRSDAIDAWEANNTRAGRAKIREARRNAK